MAKWQYEQSKTTKTFKNANINAVKIKLVKSWQDEILEENGQKNGIAGQFQYMNYESCKEVE